ncbi:unnamed protein product, partial [Lampetra fluviatilis]
DVTRAEAGPADTKRERGDKGGSMAALCRPLALWRWLLLLLPLLLPVAVAVAALDGAAWAVEVALAAEGERVCSDPG